MDERKFQSLQPWPEVASEEGASCGTGASGNTNSNRDAAKSPAPHLETIEILSTLSKNPRNIGLLCEVAKAELESLSSQLAAQVAQCAELEEERATNQFVGDLNKDGMRDDQSVELRKYRDMEQQLKSERRKHMDFGVKYSDMKKELEAAKKLLGIQDVEMVRDQETSRTVEERLDQTSKELRDATDMMGKQSVEIENERQAHRDLHYKYEQQAIELREALARVDRQWVEYDQVKDKLKQRNIELKSARAKIKTLESDVDASRTAIVELSSQLEGQLDELEELRMIKSTNNENRCRELEKVSLIHTEFAAICDDQASEIVQLKMLLEDKDAQLEKQRNEYDRREQRHRLEMEDEEKARTGMEEKLANVMVELAAARNQVESQSIELERAVIERDLLRFNAEKERTERMARLRKQYASATRTKNDNSSTQGAAAAAAASPRFGFPSMRAKRVSCDKNDFQSFVPLKDRVDSSSGN